MEMKLWPLVGWGFSLVSKSAMYMIQLTNIQIQIHIMKGVFAKNIIVQ